VSILEGVSPLRDKLIRMILKAKEKGGEVLTAPITGSSHLIDDVGLDSLQMIDLVLMIESELEVEVDFDSFRVEHLASLDRLTMFVEGLPKA